MSYPKQESVASRLQDEALDELFAMRDWRSIERSWRQARTQMRGTILDTYRHFFANEKWTLVSLRSSGAIHHLTHGVYEEVNRFKKESLLLAKTSLNDLYLQSLLRHAWVIDQTTPPNIKVRIPHKKVLLESRSQIAYYVGEEATQKFGEQWNAWADGYYSALINNIQLGALNESTMSDAADEVDATTVGTPRSLLIDAFQRMFAFESMYAINNAVESVSNVNEEADVVQIWETRRNLRVCDDCDANEGLTEEEVDGWIPLHPNCRCYWRIVPKSWAALLRTGDDNDYATALDMDSAGLVPNAMALKDPSGKLAGYVTVTFDSWMKDNFPAVATR
jgi:hypothetical protein